MTKPLTSVEEFNELAPETKQKVEDQILTEIDEAYVADDLIKLEEINRKPWLPENIRQHLGNSTNVRNRNAILEAKEKIIKDKKRMASVAEIVLETGLSHTTVYNHLKEMNSLGFQEEEMLIFSLNRAKYLKIIGDEAEKSARGAKMALDIIIASQKQTGPTLSVTNAIQIVMSLPKEEQEKIKVALLNSGAAAISNNNQSK